MIRDKVTLALLVLILINVLAHTSGVSGVKAGFAGDGAEGTLIDSIRSYLNSSMINWTANYYGLLFNKQTESDLENQVDLFANASDWVNVLRWSARLQKLGIEREQAIRNALQNTPKCGQLPETYNNSGKPMFLIYDRDVLYSTFYYSEKYGFATDRWNKTNAYLFMKNAMSANATNHLSSLGTYANGGCWNFADRFYDENAQTASAYLIFHELGVEDALSASIDVWNYVNCNHWNETTQHYDYRRTWAGYECESAYFAKIFSLLYCRDQFIENISRLVTDTETRFLNQGWDSPQWLVGSTEAYVVLHMNPSNPQRRLQNTLGAWFVMLGFYDMLSPDCQTSLRSMLLGSATYEPAWKLLYSPNAMLYDNSTKMFKMASSDLNVTSDATVVSLVLQSLMGIAPINTTMALPLEEYHYEYNFDVDPELFRVDVVNDTLRIAVTGKGTMEFTYGNSPVYCIFPESGVYEIGFSHDWDTILNVSKLQDLPTNRRYLPNTFAKIGHEIGVLDVSIEKSVVGRGNSLTVNATIANLGNFTETFNVTAYANNAIIDKLVDFSLLSDESRILTFGWNTSEAVKGEYAISVRADSVPLEANVTNNYKAASETVTVISTEHDVAIRSATIQMLNIDVVAKNYGSYTETFNVSVLANSTLIGLQSITLESGASATIFFNWNATGWLKGNYIIECVAEAVQGETDTTDNVFAGGVVYLGPLGDVNLDWKVDVKDVALVSRAYASMRVSDPADPKYGQYWHRIPCRACPHPACVDIVEDGKVDVKDVATVSRHFGEHYP
ncbi:hypothetical protein MUP01_01100 [Candidatus Bathyarchaeota archaeon]|nr:hypothetical protein [Candidatus Bathyarchaeota archaeon]